MLATSIPSRAAEADPFDLDPHMEVERVWGSSRLELTLAKPPIQDRGFNCCYGIAKLLPAACKMISAPDYAAISRT